MCPRWQQCPCSFGAPLRQVLQEPLEQSLMGGGPSLPWIGFLCFPHPSPSLLVWAALVLPAVQCRGEISSFCVQLWGWEEPGRWSSCVAAASHPAEHHLPGLVAGEGSEETQEAGRSFFFWRKIPRFVEGKEKLKQYLFYSILSLQRG